MKVLVFNSYFLTPVLERELELVTNHLEAGDEVRLVRCTGQMKSCLLNPKHRCSICTYCIGKFNSGYRIAGLRDDQTEVLPEPPSEGDPDVPKVFETIDDLKAWTYDGADLGMAVASTLIWLFHKDHRFDPRQYAEQVHRELQMSVFIYNTFLNKPQQESYDRVYIFNGRHSTTRPVLRACQKVGVDCYTHERASSPQRYRLRKNTLPHDLRLAKEDIKRIISEGGAEVETVGKQFFDRGRHKLEHDGHVATYSELMQSGRLPDDLDTNKHNVVIFNSTIQEMEGMDDYKNRVYNDELDGIHRILRDCESDSSIHFYVRIHPNFCDKFRDLTPDNNTQLRELHALPSQYSNVTLIEAASDIDSYALMDACDRVVVFGSTTGVEATYWGTASVLAGAPTPYEDLDCCHVGGAHEEILELIKDRDLPSKPAENALKFGYVRLAGKDGIPYRHFEQTARYSGLFNGNPIHPSLCSRLTAYMLRLTEIRSVSDVKELIAEFKKARDRG